MAFLRFMSQPAGRALRVALGAGMIAVSFRTDRAARLLRLASLAPLMSGALDFCLIAPLVGKPARGRDLRAARE